MKLIDFGNIRKIPQNNQKLYNFSGTKEYMAPGIIMYNMLTGVDPFSAEDDLDYKENIKFKDIKFEYIKNEKLRELNKKLLNRFVARRISVKEALSEIKKIKEEKLKLKNK